VWAKGRTFHEVAQTYIEYTNKHFGPLCHIVFDGYNKEGLKMAEHSRRYHKQGPDVIIDPNAIITIPQELFLANSGNKKRFIEFLCTKFSESGMETSVAEGDADVLIVRTAVQSTMNEDSTTVLVGEDIDLLVIAITLCDPQRALLYMKPGKGSKGTVIYNVSNLASDEILKAGIMFTHAFTGCDSTSAIFGKGKVRFWKLLQDLESDERAEVFNNFNTSNMSPDSIFKSSCKAFFLMYRAPEGVKSLNLVRYKSFQHTASKRTVDLHSLCPTEEAARQHGNRVYLQVQMWRGNELRMTDWGWRRDGSTLIPLGTTAPPAPAQLLKQLFCTCKKGCGNACGCRKLGKILHS